LNERREIKMKIILEKNKGSSKKDIYKYLKEENKVCGTVLKKKLFESGLLEEECIKCGIGPNWNGEKLTLQLDHINGINTDNRLLNLRILCPNCHTQTITYSGKNKITNKKCIDCNKRVYRTSKRCLSCENTNRIGKNRKVIQRPTRKELIKMILIDKIPFVRIGEKYGVSDAAIRKWCIKENLPITKKEINKHRTILLKEFIN
jgi:Zn ribbon nucleic-acid-binding protein